MSFRRAPARSRPAHASDLESRLQKEFASPSEGESTQPIIIAEPPGPEQTPVTRLYVIWDDWEELSLQDRSEIIMNAYVQTEGQQAGSRISVALGVTSPEAKRMGMI